MKLFQQLSNSREAVETAHPIAVLAVTWLNPGVIRTTLRVVNA